MAGSAAITAVINHAVEIGANLSVETGSRLYRLDEDIEWIERQMRHFNSCLKDAESKQDGSQEVANLIIDIQDLALDIQDSMDTYLPEIASREGKGPFRFVKHAACILCYGGTTNTFSQKIKEIKRRAQEIEATRERCRINLDTDGGNADSEVWNRRREFLVATESMVVGREDTFRELEEKLRSSECKMICVVGEAGVGKTTVGKKIYKEMRNNFTCSALVYVSNEPRVQELQLEIAKQVGLGKEEMDEKWKVNLLSLLEKKSCLIFLDDIWTTKAWDEFKNVIPVNLETRSRIIITSRYTHVGRYIGGERSLVELNHLDQEKSWELFSKMIKSSSENTSERFPSIELEDIARKIVERCGGLPLAIVVAVGMLQQRRRNRHAWNNVLDILSTSTQNDCSEILSLSYQDLPPDLRPFFLYFGLFPEYQEISASELVKAWVAEKLIQVDEIRNPDDVVADKLEILSDRNLIQVLRRDVDGRVKCCRIHDRLRVICIDMAKKYNFFGTCRNTDTSSFSTLRRLTIEAGQYSFSNSRTPKLRSLLYFSNSSQALIPNEIGNLSSLTYLKLSGRFKRMPSSIRNLKKLVTLDIQQAIFYCDLPRTILRMKYLKHLLMCDTCIFESKMEHSYVRDVYLPNIETLEGLPGIFLKASSLKRLPNLRRLSISMIFNQQIDVISGTTLILEKLQELRLTSINTVMGLNMSHYDHLAKLHLQFSFSLQLQLDQVEFPPNLIHLTISNTFFNEDPMTVLKELPRLEILELENCDYCLWVRLDFSGANSFPVLQVLAIEQSFEREFPNLIVDQTGLPKLYKFICSDAYLNVPERLRNIMVKP